jgi:lipoprotein-releasing system ATP-binding protein
MAGRRAERGVSESELVPAGARGAREEPLLSFVGVGRRRLDGGRERVVLRDVSFALGAGERLGVYGARRSGKSTLARLAAGVEAPDEGSVRVGGRDLSAISGGERARLLRSQVALLGAEGWLASAGRTVLDHVAMSAGSAGLSLRMARRRALEALDAVDAAGASAEEMSGVGPGERARALLAGALVHDPRLLIVDEPAPLPSLLERERFCARLRELARERGIALLVLSEELAALQGLPVLATLANGELCLGGESGAVIELRRRRA